MATEMLQARLEISQQVQVESIIGNKIKGVAFDSTKLAGKNQSAHSGPIEAWQEYKPELKIKLGHEDTQGYRCREKRLRHPDKQIQIDITGYFER